ncbi:glutathione S-transferase family protein [Conexibacter sp. DBS9H8]|uniref:glutathione S-transferase family protein n=1 Tax=Conexibacter sp. DBS9H8 TaxID=2937801 RepID=UPI00200FAE77|nr:glutathione S-transferase family protein [Conexibacter sp. DBS9H8]
MSDAPDAMPRPRLWSWNLSPFAGKARIALAIRGIEVELIEIDPVARPPRLAEINPANRVPVLEVGDRAITQSTAICEWAQETGTGPSLWPEDPIARAQARGLLRWVEDEIVTNFFLSMRKQVFGLDEAHDHPNLIANLRGALGKRWRPLDRMLTATDGPWLAGGADPSLADLAAMPVAVRLPQWLPDLAPDPVTVPAAAAWLAALSDHPAAVEVDRSGQPLAG